MLTTVQKYVIFASEASDPISKTMHFLPAYLASSLSVISLKHLVRWEKRGEEEQQAQKYIFTITPLYFG